jgi:hypothetical protein
MKHPIEMHHSALRNSILLKRPFTDAYLLAYSDEHLLYEVDNFFNMANFFCAPNPVGELPNDLKHTVKMAVIEACSIHLRNIIDFLYNDRPRPTDVVASDFCVNWQHIRGVMPPNLDEARVRSNQEVAHLTSARIPGAPPQKAWDFTSLANEIRPVLTALVANARKTALSPNIIGAAQ